MKAGVRRWVFFSVLAYFCAGTHAFAAPETERLCRHLVQTFDAAAAAYRANLTAAAIQPLLKPGIVDAVAEARSNIDQSKTPVDEARGWLALAVAHRNLGKYGDGNAALDRAEALLRNEAKPSELSGDVQRERATILVRLGNLEGALARYRKAEGIFAEALGAKAIKVALTLQNESWMLRDLEYYEDALAALNQAGTIYERYPVKHAADLVEVLIETSIIHARLAETKDALTVAERAAALAAQRIGPAHRSTARALHHVGISNRRLMRFAEAVSALAKVHKIYLSQGHEALGRAAEALEDASLTLSTAGCFETALTFRLNAEELYVRRFGPDHDQAADAMHRTAKMLLEMKHSAEAEAKLRAVVQVFEQTLGPESPRIAYAYADMAAVLTELGRHDEAVEYGLSSLHALQRDGKNPLRYRQALLSLARALDGKGNRRGAIVIAKMAVNMQQEIRAQNRNLSPVQARSLGERYRELYLYLAELLVGVERFGEAQRVIDLIKEQEVLDFVRGGRPQLNSADGRAVLTKTEQQATDAITELLQRPVLAARELAELEAIEESRLTPAQKTRIEQLRYVQSESMDRVDEAIAGILDSLQAESEEAQHEVVQLHLDWYGQEQEKLREFKGRAVRLQVASLKDAVHLILTTEQQPFHVWRNIPREEFARMAYAAWDSVAHRRDDAQEKLEAVYDVMIGPVEQHLKDSKAEVIILNLEGFTRYIPVAALHSGKHYLVQDYALALQTPAAKTIYAKPERKHSNAVGFGVTQARGEFSALPGVAAELETIFEGSDATGVFTGKAQLDGDFDEGSFEKALRGKPQFIHIASHFQLTPGDEAKSFLVVGKGDNLPITRLRKFNFGSVDLLTLSACDTAGQVGSDGKEVESFATLAQKKGASSVMATLWPIADGPTGALMSDFYHGLIDDGLDKASALQRAQIAMITNGGEQQIASNRSRGASERAAETVGEEESAPPVPASHPYFWSSFIIMGNWL